MNPLPRISMRVLATSLAVSVVFVPYIAVLFLMPARAEAASVPTILSYQGRLTNSSGSLLGNSGTTYYFKFSIWNSATVGAGSRLWPSSAPTATTANVRQGVFTVNIGDTAGGYPDALDYTFDAETVYLQVEVSSDNATFETLSPRHQISSAAFAQVAGATRGADQSAIGTTTPHSTSVLTVEATTTSTTALTLRAFPSQSADLFSVLSSAGASLLSINSSGSLVLGSLNGPLHANNGVVAATTSIGALYGGTGQTSYSVGDILYASAVGTLTKLPVGSTGQVLKVSGGVPSWGADLSGSGGASAWATSTNDLFVYPGDTSDVILIGASATSTTGNIFEVLGNSLFRGTVTAYNTVTAPSFSATSTSLASRFNYATTTMVSATTSSSTNLIASNSFTFSNVSGFLKATAGAVATSLINLASDVTGILPVANGGTGWANVASNAILFGNGTGALATTTAGTNGQILALASGVPTWVSTTTAGTGLTYTGSAFNVTLGTSIAASEIADADHGDFTYASGVATLDADTVADSEIDYSAVTLTDFTNDADFVKWTNATSSLWKSTGFISSASSTIVGGLTITGNATATAATTTHFAVTGTASTSALVVSNLNSASCDVKASSAGVLSCGTDATGGASFGQAWEIFGSGPTAYLAPTSTIKSLIAVASSTIGDGTQTGGLTVFGGATTTGTSTVAGLKVTSSANLFGTIGSSLSDFCVAITGGSGLCDGTDNTGGGNGLATSTDITDTWIIYGTSVSDVGAEAAFTYNDATNLFTVSNASTTNLTASYASSTLWYGGGLVSNCDSAQFLQWTSGQFGCGTPSGSGQEPFPSNATTTLLAFSGGLISSASSTFNGNVTITGNATTSAATTTSLAISTISSGSLLKTTTGGAVVAAVAGTDYVSSVGFGKTFEQGTNTFSQAMLSPTTTTLNLHIGGIGTSTFVGGLEAWRQISAPYFNATSTATSTFAGGVNVKAINQTGTATSTFANGIQLATGCFEMPDGTCLGGSGASALEDLSDVAAMTKNFGDLLYWDGSTWTDLATSSLDIYATGLGAADFGEFTCNGTTCSLDAESQTIAEASDVTITAATFGELLTYDGSAWVDTATSSLDLYATGLGAADFGEFTCNGTTCTLDAESQTLAEGSDVTIAGAAYGDLLMFDGSAWADTATSTLFSNSSQFAGWLSDESGTGAFILGTSPSLSSPSIATPSITTSLTVTDDDWIGLSATAANIEFDDLTRDEINILNANVGVGSSTPWALLSVHAFSGQTNTTLFAVASSTASATTTLFSVSNTGLTSIGDPSGTGDAIFQLAGDTNAWALGYYSTDKTFRIASSTNLTSNVYFQIGKSGTTTLNSAITSSNVGQYLCISATTFEIFRNNSACAPSSERFKENIIDMSYGLDAVMQLRPVTFTFKEDMNFGTTTQLGFIAEEVEGVIPEIVAYGNDGLPSGLNYPLFTSVLTKAVQDLNLKIEDIATTTPESEWSSESFASRFLVSIKDRLSTWFADAANGIGEFVANRFRAKEEICVDDQCLTKDDVRKLIDIARNGLPAQAGQVAGAGSISTPPPPEPAPTEESTGGEPDDSPPVMTLNGENPVTVEVGAVYTDAGVVVFDNVDENLVPNIFVDNEQVEVVELDTSTVSNHTIRYYVKDTAGNTAEVSRTVIVDEIASESVSDTELSSISPDEPVSESIPEPLQAEAPQP